MIKKQKKSVVLKNEAEETAVIIGIRDSFYISDLNKFESFYLKLTGWDLKNEKDTILKSIDKYKNGFNIFDSFHSMIFTSKNLVNIFHQNDISIFKLDELEGYVVGSNNSFNGPKYKEIVILKDEKIYSVTLFNTYLEDDQLTDFISTFVVE